MFEYYVALDCLLEWMSKFRISDVTYLACLTLHLVLKIVYVQNRLKIMQHELCG